MGRTGPRNFLKRLIGKQERTGSPAPNSSDGAMGDLARTDQGQSQIRENFGLFPMYSGGAGENVVDIVAVHGLSGDWEDTWTDSGKLWLRDFVRPDAESHGTRLRIWSFGYDSATVLSNAVTDIDDAAVALIDALDGERRNQPWKSAPIIFIAHSLGGIVVKHALTLARERSDHWQGIVDNVFGIMFFAVPHRGSDQAYWATIASRLEEAMTLGLAGNKNFVEALKRNSPQLQRISQSFIQPASKLRIIRTFYETDKIGNQVVVDKDSAILGLNNERAIPIQGANHRTICKFSREQSQKYRAVRNALTDIMKAVRHRQLELFPNDEEQVSDAQIRSILHDKIQIPSIEEEFIKALAFPGMINVQPSSISPDYQGWLYQNDTFSNWLQLDGDPTNRGLLWIKGSPGSGKTTAITDCYHHLSVSKAKKAHGHHLLAFFFDRTAAPLQRSLVGMYRTLLYQLLRRRPHAIRNIALQFDLDSLLHEDPPFSTWTEQIWQAQFSKVVEEQSQSSTRTTMLIDAVDECSTDNAATQLDQYFRDMAHRSPKLKVCLTTTPFGSSGIYQGPDIKVESANRGAIQSYIDMKLEIRTRDDRRELESIGRKMEIKSRGIFLWVHVAVDFLLKKIGQGVRNVEYLEKQLSSLPNNLQDLYGAILREIDDTEQRQMTLQFFRWMIFAPDLSLRGWRDLLPFLQRPAPTSLKSSHVSEYWAAGKDGLWMENLDHLICRVSLGLVRVIPSFMLPFSDDAAENISVNGNAGSLDLTAGDTRVLQPIHGSVRQLFETGDGFTILNSESAQDHKSQSFISLMHTCLDFMVNPELDEFITLRNLTRRAESRQSRPSTTKSSGSSSSDNASRKSSVRSFTSANTLQHGKVRREAYSTSSDSSRLSRHDLAHSTRVSKEPRVGLGRLVKDESDPDRHALVNEWVQKMERVPYDWTTSSQSDNENSHSSLVGNTCDKASFDKDMMDFNRFPEFLHYALSVFPQLAMQAEYISCDAGTIIERLRNPDLLHRYLCLSEEADTDITLQQWAETHELFSWLLHLCLSQRNLYADQSPSCHSSAGNEFDLPYCFDHGDAFVKGHMKRAPSTPKCRSIEHMSATCSELAMILSDEEADESAPANYDRHSDQSSKRARQEIEILLSEEMTHDAHQCDLTKDSHSHYFIPYRRLQVVLTKELIAKALPAAKVDSKLVDAIMTSYLRFFAAALWCRCFKQNFTHVIRSAVVAQKDDTQLMLTEALNGSHYFNKKLTGKLAFHYRILSSTLSQFTSPFFARPFGKTQHYILAPDTIIPIVECKHLHQNSSDPWSRRTRRGWIRSYEVKLHPESFDFGVFESHRDTRFMLVVLSGFYWVEFLAGVFAWLHLCHRLGRSSEIHPLLCTFQKHKPDDEAEKRYYLLYSRARGTLEDFLEIDPSPWKLKGKISETWLIEQCLKMASAIRAMNDIASLKIPKLPRLRFLHHDGLFAGDFSWFSASTNDVGTLVLSNAYWASRSVRTHMPPEYYTREQSKIRARVSHVWCLATLWLDVITWYLFGPAGLTSFKEKRKGPDGWPGYIKKIEIDHDESKYEMSDAVMQWMDKLDDCVVDRPGIKAILELVRGRMLVVDVNERAKLNDVTEELERIKNPPSIGQNGQELPC